jgi:hypothetical protein
MKSSTQNAAANKVHVSKKSSAILLIKSGVHGLSMKMLCIEDGLISHRSTCNVDAECRCTLQ